MRGQLEENIVSVEPFDPGAMTPGLGPEQIAELVAAAERLEAPDFGLSRDRVSALSVVARDGEGVDWSGAAEVLEAGEAIALIRLFTLAERLPGWEAGARSPVIPLAAELKRRGEYPPDLTAWIRGHTGNRFLPYGSLLGRL